MSRSVMPVVSTLHVLRHLAVAAAFITLSSTLIFAQKSAGPVNGTLIVDGGGTTEPVVRRFVELAGGPQARIVVIATAPSSIRFGDDNVVPRSGLASRSKRVASVS